MKEEDTKKTKLTEITVFPASKRDTRGKKFAYKSEYTDAIGELNLLAQLLAKSPYTATISNPGKVSVFHISFPDRFENKTAKDLKAFRFETGQIEVLLGWLRNLSPKRATKEQNEKILFLIELIFQNHFAHNLITSKIFPSREKSVDKIRENKLNFLAKLRDKITKDLSCDIFKRYQAMLKNYVELLELRNKISGNELIISEYEKIKDLKPQTTEGIIKQMNAENKHKEAKKFSKLCGSNLERIKTKFEQAKEALIKLITELADQPDSTKFILPLAKKFLSERKLTDYIKLAEKYSEFKIVPFNEKIPDKIEEDFSSIYQGVHVEAKGVHYVKTYLDKSATEFLVGLGNESGMEPGCCCFCTYEFNRLEEGRPLKLNVYRSADFPYNTPVVGYRLSPYMNGIMPVDKVKSKKGNKILYLPKAKEIEAANEKYFEGKIKKPLSISSDKIELLPLADKLKVAMNELIPYEAELGSESLLSAISMIGASDELTS